MNLQLEVECVQCRTTLPAQLRTLCDGTIAIAVETCRACAQPHACEMMAHDSERDQGDTH